MDVRAEKLDSAFDLFFEKINPHSGQIVAAYVPHGREFDVYPLIDMLLERQIACALPVVKESSLELGFALWDGVQELEKGAYGILAPAQNAQAAWVEPDIVIVPLLAFDRRGYRLGQGGGYYDATLRALRNKKPVMAVGIGFAQQACLFPLPVEEHDEKLDWVVTPQEAHYFGA